MKPAAKALIGRTITHAVVTRSATSSLAHLFLVFSDESYYEFYADGELAPISPAPAGIVGMTIRNLNIATDSRTGASQLTLVGDENQDQRYASPAEIRTTSTFWGDGLEGAFGHFPDDVVVAHFGPTPRT